MINDIKTIILDARAVTQLIAVCSIGIAFIHLFAARRYGAHVGRAMRFCGCGFGLAGIGHVLNLLVYRAPDLFTRVVSPTLTLAGLVGYYLAVQALKQQKTHYRYCLAVLCVNFLLLGWFWFIEPNLPARLMVLNLCIAAVLWPLCTALCRRVRPDQRATWWPAGALFACLFLFLIARTMVVVAGYAAYRPLTDGFMLPALFYKSTFVIPLLAGLLFMLMASDEIAAQVSRLASLDTLTSIYNRRAFDELAGRSLLDSSKCGKTSSLLTLDLDHFKTINDRYGHAMGDRVLKRVTEAIAAQLRSRDIFGRYGGEEFSILLPDTAAEQALLVAERLRQVVQDLRFDIETVPMSLTVSIGLATDRGTPKALERLFDESDRALYLAKAQGRNQVALAWHDGVAQVFETGPRRWLGICSRSEAR